MFFFLPTPAPDDQLLMLVQRRFHGEASPTDVFELEELLQNDPRRMARVRQIERDLCQNRVLVLVMKALTNNLTKTESEDLSAFMRTSRRNRELFESLQAALKHQAGQRMRGSSETFC